MVMVFFILLNYGDFLLTKIGCFRLTLFGDFLLTLTKPQIETRKIDEDSVLRMEQVCFSYDKKEVLHDISFAIQKIRKLELLEKVAVESQRL